MLKRDRQKHYWLIEYLDVFFEDINKTLCSNCPEANVRTALVARMKQTGFSKQCGCCSRCAFWKGYFKDVDEFGVNFINLKKEYNFDIEDGFFDKENHQCKLPREKRSVCCLCFMCLSIEKKYNLQYDSFYVEVMNIEIVRDRLRRIREKNNMLI